MCQHRKTPNIAVLFARRGQEWSDSDRRETRSWLELPDQRRCLLTVALANLGDRAQWRDAEDAWSDFRDHRLDRIIDSYDPTKGSGCFWPYLLLCFQRWCWDESRRIARNAPEGGEQAHLLLGNYDWTHILRDQARTEEACKRLRRAFDALRADYREVLWLRYVEGLSVREIANRLGETFGTINMRVFHARTELEARYLEEEQR